MAVSLGCGLNIEADEVMENIKRTIKTCRKHKMSIGIFMDDESNVKSWKNLGINIFWIGTELSLLCSALSNVHNATCSCKIHDVKHFCTESVIPFVMINLRAHLNRFRN